MAGKYSESGSAGCAYFDSASVANDDKKQNEDLVTKNGGGLSRRVGGIRALLELLSRTKEPLRCSVPPATQSQRHGYGSFQCLWSRRGRSCPVSPCEFNRSVQRLS